MRNVRYRTEDEDAPWYSNHAAFEPQQSQQIAARERRVVEDGNTAMDGFGAS